METQLTTKDGRKSRIKELSVKIKKKREILLSYYVRGCRIVTPLGEAPRSLPLDQIGSRS